MTKAELEKKKKLARTLYMAGKDQNEIADQIDISRQTLSLNGPTRKDGRSSGLPQA